eukprot:jgi/Undpi1/1014/HiC_scaffold_10.g04478.m1
MSPCRSPAPSMTSNDHDRQTTATSTPSWSVLGTAAACLATATIATSSLPADASPLPELSSARSERHGAPTLMVLAEAGESADGRADVTGLVSDLKRGQTAESVLNTMVKINEAVDADEDGLLENPFARESVVKSLMEKRRAGGEAWDGDTEGAYGILKRKLDPFNVVLLRSYLKIAPFLGGAYYLAVFFVQQKFRGFFAYAYFGAVAVFVAPAAIILLTN